MNPCGPTLSGPARPSAIETAMAVRMSTTIGMTSTPSAASFTSLDWIFLPRYSGVRPTMSPPRKTVDDREQKNGVEPAPRPAGADLAEHHAGEEGEAPDRRVGVVRRVDRSGRGLGGRDVVKDRVRDAEPDLLALDVPPGLVGDAGLGDRGVCPGARRPRPSRSTARTGSPSRRRRRRPGGSCRPSCRRCR